MVGFTPWPLYSQEKSPWVSLLGGPQSLSGRGGEKKNSKPLPGLEPLIIHSVAERYTTELSYVLHLVLLFKKPSSVSAHSSKSEATAPLITYLVKQCISTARCVYPCHCTPHPIICRSSRMFFEFRSQRCRCSLFVTVYTRSI
jgi:hypothetical protein